MKTSIFAQAIFTLLALAPVTMPANPLPPNVLNESLLIEEDLLVRGRVEISKVLLENNVLPGYSIEARWNGPGDITSIEQLAYGSVVCWSWSHHNVNGANQLMRLDVGGQLSLYGPDNFGAPVIVLDPIGANPQIMIAGRKVLTEGDAGTSPGGGVGNESISMGFGATASGYESAAIGAWSNAMGNSSMALGNWARTCSDSSVAFGFNSFASGEYSSALGSGADANGDYTISLGAWATTHGNAAMSIGNASQAEGDGSLTIGYYAAAVRPFATAIGYMAQAEGRDSLAVGFNAWTHSDKSLALGLCAQTAAPYQTALGAFNRSVDDAAFMIGNGTAENKRSNLFVIMNDGRGIFRSKSYTDPATPVLVQAQEALTVKGAATIEGDATIQGSLKLSRRQGDIGMGSFGRSEDAAP